MIVVVIVPAFTPPGVRIFVPPAMAVVPAPLAGFLQVRARPLGFWAVPSVVLSGFVQLMVGVSDSLLAIVIGADSRRGAEQQHSRAGQRP